MLNSTLLAATLFAAASSPLAAEAPTGLTWHEGDLGSALQAAESQDTHVLVYFWRDGSEHCAALYQETLATEMAAKAVGSMVCVSANYDDPAGAKLFERYGVSTLPTVLFVTPDGSADDALLGYVDGTKFETELARIHTGEGTRSGLERVLSSEEVGSEAAIEACFALAGKHLDLGNSGAHDECLVALREKHDPKARTVIGARAHLWAAESAVNAQLANCECGEGSDGHCKREASVVKADLKPLYAHAKRMKLAEARFEAWSSIGNFEARSERVDDAVKAFTRASKDVPDAQAIAWNKGVAGWVLNSPKPTAKQTSLALRCATTAAKTAEKLDPESELCHEITGGHKLELVQAEAIATLALTQSLVGKDREARKSAERALALAGEYADSFREHLAELLES